LLRIKQTAEKSRVLSSVAKVMLTVSCSMNGTMATNSPEEMHDEQQNILRSSEGQS
jgi:hypothetical protein